MAGEANTTFPEVFSQASLTYSIKLLPWCVSSTVPLYYISKVLYTVMQQEEDVPTTITVPRAECSQAPETSDSLAHQTGTPPLPVHPFLDIPLWALLLLGILFLGFRASPLQEKWGCFLSGTLSD